MEDGSAQCSQDGIEFEIDEGYPDEDEEDLGCEEDQECREGLVLRVVSGLMFHGKGGGRRISSRTRSRQGSSRNGTRQQQKRNKATAEAEAEQSSSRNRTRQQQKQKKLASSTRGLGRWVRKSTSTSSSHDTKHRPPSTNSPFSEADARRAPSLSRLYGPAASPIAAAAKS
jgi:chromatin remodeling complex protein RSC6